MLSHLHPSSGYHIASQTAPHFPLDDGSSLIDNELHSKANKMLSHLHPSSGYHIASQTAPHFPLDDGSSLIDNELHSKANNCPPCKIAASIGLNAHSCFTSGSDEFTPSAHFSGDHLGHIVQTTNSILLVMRVPARSKDLLRESRRGGGGVGG